MFYICLHLRIQYKLQSRVDALNVAGLKSVTNYYYIL